MYAAANESLGPQPTERGEPGGPAQEARVTGESRLSSIDLLTVLLTILGAPPVLPTRLAYGGRR
jgi:hypothetical protein